MSTSFLVPCGRLDPKSNCVPRVSLSEEAWSRSLDVPAEALLDGFWSQGLGLRMDDNLNIEGPAIAHDEPAPTILSGLLLILLS